MDAPILTLVSNSLQLAIVCLLGIVSYFLKRAINDVDALATKVQGLETRVAILLDRDRRQRIEDYNKEEWGGA